MKRKTIAGRKVISSPVTSTRVLCFACHSWFTLPRQCLELSNWDCCEACLAREGAETRRILRSRGITCLSLPGDADD